MNVKNLKNLASKVRSCCILVQNFLIKIAPIWFRFEVLVKKKDTGFLTHHGEKPVHFSPIQRTDVFPHTQSLRVCRALPGRLALLASCAVSWATAQPQYFLLPLHAYILSES